MRQIIGSLAMLILLVGCIPASPEVEVTPTPDLQENCATTSLYLLSTDERRNVSIDPQCGTITNQSENITTLLAAGWISYESLSNLSFETITKYEELRYGIESYMTFEDENDWEEFWKKHTQHIEPTPPVPEINFTTHNLIAIFLGGQSTGGYAITIENIRVRGRLMIVTYSVQEPKPGDGVTQAFTTPYHIVKVPKHYKSLRYVERTAEPGLCAGVCIAMWRLTPDNQCVYDSCGSGCGADNINTFNYEQSCQFFGLGWSNVSRDSLG